MLDPAELYELTEAEVPAAAPVLIVALEGFVDAGNAARLAVGSMREGREPRTLARFDVDQLIDYRSRRPPLRFDTDHWESYAAPDLDVVAAHRHGRTPSSCCWPGPSRTRSGSGSPPRSSSSSSGSGCGW